LLRLVGCILLRVPLYAVGCLLHRVVWEQQECHACLEVHKRVLPGARCHGAPPRRAPPRAARTLCRIGPSRKLSAPNTRRECAQRIRCRSGAAPKSPEIPQRSVRQCGLAYSASCTDRHVVQRSASNAVRCSHARLQGGGACSVCVKSLSASW
jgi:hypothetical protein